MVNQHQLHAGLRWFSPARAPWWSTSISSMLGFADFSGLPEASNTEKLPRVMTIQELRGTPACSCRYCSCGPPPILTSWLKTKWRRGKPGPHNLLYQKMLLPADSRSALFPSCCLMLTWLHGLIWRRFLQRGATCIVSCLIRGFVSMTIFKAVGLHKLTILTMWWFLDGVSHGMKCQCHIPQHPQFQGQHLMSFGVPRVVRLELRILPVLLNLDVKPEDLHLGKCMQQRGEIGRVRQIHEVFPRFVEECARDWPSSMF